MPIHLDYDFQPVKISDTIDNLQCGDQTLLVWWYCGIKKNPNERSQPHVLVAFRTQIARKTFSDNIFFRSIPIALLGQLSIGSLCRNNRVIACAQFEVKRFQLRHEQEYWRFTSFDEATEKSLPPPFPQQIYPLKYQHDKNWLIKFKLPQGGSLLIPCLEYFARCYGRSGELRRILATYKWDGQDNCLDRFFAPLGEPEDPAVWKINIRANLHSGDSVFLAHVKYDSYTRLEAKKINSTIDTEYSNDKNKPIFLCIGPWFTGKAELLVSGISFNNKKSFLGLQIHGVSEPVGEDIERTREGRNDAFPSAGQDALGNTWTGSSARKTLPRPEIVNLTEFDVPDKGSSTLELHDPALQILGERRKVHTIRDKKTISPGRPSTTGSDTYDFSTSEPYGNGKGVGQASVITKVEMESEGALRDMWNALLYLKKHYANDVSSVSWYSPSKGYLENEEPELIALEAFTEEEILNDETITTPIIKWPFIDKDTLSQLRGLLVARVNIKGKTIHIIEIQRRLCKYKDDSGKISEKEESLCGLVFMLDNQNEFNQWLNFVKSNVRQLEGVVKYLASSCPGKAGAFKHSTATGEYVPCWAALKNALSKMEIAIK